MFAIKSYHDTRIAGDAPIAPADMEAFDDVALDRLLIDQAIEAPGGWGAWTAAEKSAWLKSWFETAPAAPTAAQSEMSTLGRTDAVRSKVSLMRSLAALSNPIEGKSLDGDGAAALTGRSRTQGIGPSDPLRYLVHEMDNLSETDALGLLGKLTNQSEVTLFRLGGVLARLKANGWRKAYGSFKAFLEAEHDIPYRKASHWMAVYRDLAASEVPWERVQKVGWAKLKEISAIITLDNVDQWVDIALDNSPRELAEIVASHKRADTRPAIAQASEGAVTRMTFKVHSGQKGAIQAAIDKAKSEHGVQAAAAALENICADYLSGAAFDREARTMGLEACLKIIEKAYPNATINVAFAEEEPQAA